MSCLFAEVRMQIGRSNKALEGGKVAEVREGGKKRSGQGGTVKSENNRGGGPGCPLLFVLSIKFNSGRI